MWDFVASAGAHDIPIGHLLSSLEGLIGLDYPLPTDGLVLSNLSLAFNLGGGEKYFTVTGTVRKGETTYGSLSLAAHKTNGAAAEAAPKTSWDYIFAIQLGDGEAGISLSKLPLIGRQLSAYQDASLNDLQVIAASKAFTQTEVSAISERIPSQTFKLPAKDLDSGFNFSAELRFGGTRQLLALPIISRRPTIPDSTSTVTPTNPVAVASSANAKWFDLQKSLGPLYLDKVGVEYQGATLWFLLDAALTGAGLTISLAGLSVGSSLSSFSPSFNLHGLGIDYQQGPLGIGAAFLRTETDGQPDQYDGAAIIKTPEWALAAMGSYTTREGEPSVFIYAFLDYPLGGPPFFFVTGVAAGFGYNRKLIVPSIDKVAEFPLVQQALASQSPPNGLLGALKALRDDIPPALGEVFLAVGVRFNSFKLIDSFALVSLHFGSHFVVNILGLSNAIIPTPEAGQTVTPLAEVQIAWQATFEPADGFLGVDARLTPNSYILSRDCSLVGGYAFYSWFSGEHAGDFVQTLGGYHPSFAVPAHYPVVPRLGFNWHVSSDLTIKGDAYYALTGSALMAGGHLEVVFDQGDLKAWLKMGADFLISWKPYHYDARIYVNVGVSYTFELDLLFGSVTVTISVDVGADLHLWGPDFSGTAEIDISVISFTIEFGADASHTPEAIDWNTFKTSFLPAENVCSIAVKDGLVNTLKEGKQERWIMNPTL